MTEAEQVAALEAEAEALTREVAALEAAQRRVGAAQRRAMREWLQLAIAGTTACDTPMN